MSKCTEICHFEPPPPEKKDTFEVPRVHWEGVRRQQLLRRLGKH